MTLESIQIGMKESEVNHIFLGYKNQLIKKLGREPLYGDVIEKVGKKLIGARFKGVYAQDKFPANKVGYYIVNTDTSNKSGTHWVAIINTKTNVYIHDSFGRKSKTILRYVVRNSKALQKKTIEVDPDLEQGNSNVCGCIVLAFLLTAKQVGMQQALKI